MNTAFALDHQPLLFTPCFAEFSHALEKFAALDSPRSFNEYCRLAIRAWQAHFPGGLGATSPLLTALRERIAQHEEKTISTSWGGVVITRHEPPQVEKFLVIQSGGYLALEKHGWKDEHLEVREGAGLVLYRAASEPPQHAENPPLRVQALLPGERFHFEPGREHCVIGTEDLLIFESGVDPKGMDQDLIFLFEPDGA